MLGIVVVAGGEGVEAAGEAVDGRFQIEIIVVGEDDVEVSVEQCRGELVEVSRDQGKTDEVALGTMTKDVLLRLKREVEKGKLPLANGGLVGRHGWRARRGEARRGEAKRGKAGGVVEAMRQQPAGSNDKQAGAT
jgi:hypothetical protein